jgi:hypothetical protein
MLTAKEKRAAERAKFFSSKYWASKDYKRL